MEASASTALGRCYGKESGAIMTETAAQWAVAIREPNDRGNPAAGHIVVVHELTSETAARSAFADYKRAAPALAYQSVTLRCGDTEVERWPGTAVS
jgi:hypothetical protein